MSPQPNEGDQARATEMFRAVVEETSTVPVSQAALEERLARANALIQLMSSALSWEIYACDTKSDSAAGFCTGIQLLEREARDGLAELCPH